MWRWILLLVIGELLALGATVVLLRASPPSYSATAVLQIDQPTLTATGNQGYFAVQKLTALMPTFAGVATSDQVLNGVSQDLGRHDSLPFLRARISASQVTNELAIRITAQDPSADVSLRLVTAVTSHFETALSDAEAVNGVAADLRMAVSPVEEPHTERPSRHEVRTLVVAGMLGLVVMGALAYNLDHARA